MSRVFVSHSRRDRDLAPWFDRVFAREKVEAVQFEFEFRSQRENPTENLRQLLQSSVALFVLLSPEITATSTLHTGNWISAEVGMAKGLNKPVWVFERQSMPVSFPVPYVDHFVQLPFGNSEEAIFDFVRGVVIAYGASPLPNEPWEQSGLIQCSNPSCQTTFQIHQNNNDISRCPVCCTSSHWDKAVVSCMNCKGKGKLSSRSVCTNCQGSGYFAVDMGSDPCPNCNGQGVMPSNAMHNNRRTNTPAPMICGACHGTGCQSWSLIPAQYNP